ncbi:MAG: sodium-translocating pyrophosphatase [Planctomycetota bacterium]
MDWIYVLSLLVGVAAVVIAVSLFKAIMLKDAGTERMQEIARAVQEGGRAFLHAEYRWLLYFVVVMALLIGFGGKGFGPKTAIAFAFGAMASAAAGYFGMHTATRAAVRTTQAARTNLMGALDVSFKSGSVMGLTVVGLGLTGIAILVLIYGQTAEDIEQVLGFSFGASSIALFARVGGGIYTKAADVGADLVGKVEAGIPEDDPRNPATIADNVGDNVGDVAGMGADLFESYVGAIIATLVLGTELAKDPAESSRLLAYPMLLSAAGILASFAGTWFVKTNDESKVGKALHHGLVMASVILAVAMAALTPLINPTPDGHSSWNVYFSMLIGLFVGVLIGQTTEYYTTKDGKPVQWIADQSRSGAATNIIAGLAVGMKSTWVPVLLTAVGIWGCSQLAGIYGICVAAVGMLATLGISLAIDAFGPVADNAGGLAEMAELDKEVRNRTDALDATGNTTAAIGKGFAIGSAALTALALFNTYQVKANVALVDAGQAPIPFALTNAVVVMGLLIGAMLPFLFSSMAMRAVGTAAGAMVDEVRRQFREIPGIMEGKAKPDYARCVSISTDGAIKAMVAPGLLAVIAPIATGMVFGKAAAAGLLAGSLGSGVMMALFMANAGGAWDNAKKYVEGGAHGGKGSPVHKAAVTGDTVGDPFKDTAGPSINILIKLMSIVSVLAIPLFR